jgi:hypothetical protein
MLLIIGISSLASTEVPAGFIYDASWICMLLPAGIVATSSAVLHAALLLAGSLQPHWLAFIDVGHLYLTSKPEEARDVKSAPLYSALAEDVPSVYAATGGVGDCLVYASILS